MAKIDRIHVHQKCDGKCGYCGNDITIKDMQVDHIVPKWMGVDNSLNNLMPSCKSCNHYKRGDTLEQFRKKMITLHERLQKDYITRVAVRYGIVYIKKFEGLFHFEKQK